MSGRRRQLYSLLSLLLCVLLLSGCGGVKEAAPPQAEITGHMELVYAGQFSVDYYSDESALITIGGTDRYLLLPEGMEAPAHDRDAVLLRKPLQTLYLAASSAMDLFLQLDALDRVRLTSTSANNWAIPRVVQALEQGDMLYAGKYSAPDFERILSEGCDLSIQSTMIYHSPDIREKLTELGVPVLVERSSYESHPLGRVEWIRLYGLLMDREEEAERFFEEQLRQLDALRTVGAEEKDVAFFYINSAGTAVVHKGGDYVAKMIELAGGRYVFEDLRRDDTALSTVNLQMESFYAGARDADVLIYSSAVGGNLDALEQLLNKSELLSDFKAVQSGNVWCTGQNMFQESSASAGMIADINAILSGQAAELDELRFLHRLR